MGQIDADKMYEIVMKWDWGNSNSDKIYHDPETRRNSITYRTNLSRLMNQLILEGKIDKAKNIINLAVTKMPLEKFGYYSLVEPFADGYYKVNEKAKAQDLLNKLVQKYKENLNYYATLSGGDQSDLAIDIITDIERYRSLLQVMKQNKDLAFYSNHKTTFNTYVNVFERFGREKE
jgi:hypothetical protein